MSLVKYKKKRSFKDTPEPVGGRAASKLLRFVVQKHAASHLHYDFRLEMDGVLKSWAVPKGPSLDTSIKRLAMMVEDHPYDYRNFEGTIPEGNYGAGNVIIWDEGTYESLEGEFTSKQMADKDLRRQLHGGKIKFALHGTKLNGKFALIKAPARGDNAWLLMKLKDEYVTTDDVLSLEKSVVSGRTIENIGKAVRANAAKKTSTRSKSSSKASTVKRKKKVLPEKDNSEVSAILEKAETRSFYTSVSPMLATLFDKPVSGPEWTYEIKWDGYRAIAFIHNKTVELKSRNDNSFEKKFYPIYEAIRAWNISAIVDGEIVALKDTGLPDFGTLQNWRSEADGPLIYYLFDILWLNGKDLRSLPLTQRRAVLHSIVPVSDLIRFSESFTISGEDFLKSVHEMGMEGIVAKRTDSPYLAGERTRDWLKIKANKRHEVVIGGYTNNDNSSKPFSSLLVGVYEQERLVYTGKIGTGFKMKQQEEMVAKFKPYITDACPFTSEPDYNKPSRFNPNPPKANATWIKPVFVCEVSYTEQTTEGIMRHPSFEGMRSDKKAKEVTREVPVPADQVNAVSNQIAAKVVDSTKRERKTFLNPTDETQVREINGHTIKFTNLSKIYWPEEKVTKRDMLNYYYQVAPYILPYLKDRPQSLNRFPNGIHGKSFYQKDVTGKVPEWVQKYLYHSNDTEVDKHFMVPQDESDVLLMASLGCIEMNPWSSRIQRPDHPDWCIIDLDPDKNSPDKNFFDQVITAAQVTHELLESSKIPSYCKTSGSTGLHIYIPLGSKYTYEQSKEFGRTIVTEVQRQLPKFTSIERKVADRGGKMYLDFLQNRPKATLAAPYSLRPKPGATVSMPLHWDEVKKGLKMKDFTIFNAIERIKELGDIFKPVLGKGAKL